MITLASAGLFDDSTASPLTVSAGGSDDAGGFTGERFLPGYADGSIELEHIHRYIFALEHVVGRRVLDIACGEGYGSELMAQRAASVVGVDVDAPTIAAARERYARDNLTFEVGDAVRIPAGDDSFDVVVSFETLEHVADQDALWSEFVRVLRPGGLLIMSSPNRDTYRADRSEANPFHVRELTQAELATEIDRRFAHSELCEQSVVFGSQISPVSAAATAAVIALDPATRQLLDARPPGRSAPYSLVLASDAPLSAAAPSLFRGHYPDNTMSSLIGGIADRDAEIISLRRQLVEASAIPPQVAAANEAALRALEETTDRLRTTIARLEENLAERDRTVEALQERIRKRAATGLAEVGAGTSE